MTNEPAERLHVTSVGSDRGRSWMWIEGPVTATSLARQETRAASPPVEPVGPPTGPVAELWMPEKELAAAWAEIEQMLASLEASGHLRPADAGQLRAG